MTTFQVIKEKDKPRFVVLPFGDEKAAEDYLDELWALKAVKAHSKKKSPKLYPMEQVRESLSL